MRVLIADDNPRFSAAAARFIELVPGLHLVGHARNGREALMQVSEVRPDLVLMDVAMPEMDGLEATRRLKERDGAAPRVVILTLHDTVEYRGQAERVGADGFISKREFATQLLDVIDRIREQR